MHSNRYQIALIALGVFATAGMGVFFYRELNPEYRIYQNDYSALEQFRSTYTGDPPPVFKEGIKQIVIEREDKGPAVIDRCTSCHVALQFPHFSPTKVSRDADGKPRYDEHGIPIQELNKEYIWSKLDQRIAELRDGSVNEQLAAEGDHAKVQRRLNEAEHLSSLKTVDVGGNIYDVTKVLAMHPLIGMETRPFEFHPVETYGCTSCHNGNGRGLTTERAHGPVFDGHYEAEFVGYVPQFLEKDQENDPQFSKVFNSKPGHELLFQTMPIYVGSLIQSKCIQCHVTASSFMGNPDFSMKALSREDHSLLDSIQSLSANDKNKELVQDLSSEIDLLTYNYHRGMELYLAQACYACHRISGFSRGGVGPELTQEGKAYPWYVKQKITWPQSDLKTSTMPNMKIDHEEVEDLMTFVLGQVGENKSISPTAYISGLQQWEAGRKLPWEKPITPAQMLDLKYSMTVFATEGCAACHRLKGYDSDVGFVLEKGKEVSYEALYQEKEWFRKMFPEEITGSQIVKTIDRNASEIDRRIVPDVRNGSILEDIEKSHPKILESFYSPLKYAKRAKNKELENDPIALKEWKNRIHRIMMMFIQEYGLGRMIGPRPNWTGVYHTDEWLMEHFRNPSGHVPRSIMPVLPFDDTKFYALTHMLDVLGIRNRNEVRAVWDHYGFSPEEAYHLHCAQCHGDYKQGNGPVAEWIYPIPKNLGDARFLRDLTKAEAINSIIHGVKGTPMPPWGEAVRKPGVNGVPVLSLEEVKALVDWLYSSLPGESGSNGGSSPKWLYSPKDAIDELRREGNMHLLKFSEDHAIIQNQPSVENLQVASLKQQDSEAASNNELEAYFDVVPNPISKKEKNLYYIKKSFYTTENIEKGSEFFLLNCAACHGKEADGSGLRAEAMHDAKPRMLTNLDWIETHDDLRLLRSIKYGVPGTAMTPWGDFTSSLQRMQLVMFIRSLSEQSEMRKQLSEAIYHAFDESVYQVDLGRSLYYPQLAEFEKKQEAIHRQREILYDKVKETGFSSKEAVDLYEQELRLFADIKRLKTMDEKYLKLKNLIIKEKEVYDNIGKSLIQNEGQEISFRQFLQALVLLNESYFFADGQLFYQFTNEKAHQLEEIENQLESTIQNQINGSERDKQITEGQVVSSERTHFLAGINSRIDSLRKLRKTIHSGFQESIRLRKEQAEAYQQLKPTAK